MKSVLSFCCLIIFSVLSAQAVNADIAKPKPPKEREGKVVLHTSLQIVPDAKAYEARLQIPQSELQYLRAALNDAPANNTLAASIARSPTRTIIAGLLLFLSVSFAGVLLARSARSGTFRFGRNQKVAGAVILAIGMFGAAAVITRGNAGPPGSYRWKNLPESLSQGRPTDGGVDIEIVPEGSGMKLIIPLRSVRPGEDE